MEMHGIYLRSAGEKSPSWEELSPFLRSSNRAAADHLPAKLRLLLGRDFPEPITAGDWGRAFRRWQETREERGELYRELEHRRRMRFYALHNWRRGERDNVLRRHPSMVPFPELSPGKQAKDDCAWALPGDLGETEGKGTEDDD